MNKRTSIALAAAALLAGITAASAATMSNSGKASDKLTLTNPQQKTAWRDLYMPSLNQTAPAGFSATVGAVVPNSVTTAGFAQSCACRSVPQAVRLRHGPQEAHHCEPLR
jgi:hypothetical protein